MSIKARSRLTVFVLSAAVWFALTDIKDVEEVIAGLVLSLIVSIIAGHFLITAENNRPLFSKIINSVKYFFVFIWEMIKANVHVAYIVLHPMLPIKPGIVKAKTNLKKDSSRTILCNSITLTPGTMTVDINPECNDVYIHWIDVVSKDPNDDIENTKKIVEKFEKILTEVSE